MNFQFNDLEFCIKDDRIKLLACPQLGEKREGYDGFQLCHVRLAGDNHSNFGGASTRLMSQSVTDLKYLSHSIEGDLLTVVQKNDRIKVTSYYKAYKNTNAIRCHSVIENVSDKDIIAESISSAYLYGIGGSWKKGNDIYLHQFTSAHHTESQPMVQSLFDLGMIYTNTHFCRVNTGSKSTNRFFPHGIIEDREKGKYLFFQIESDNCWYYEMGADSNGFYLYLSANDGHYHQWAKKLAPGESFTTVAASFAFGDSLNDVLKNITLYRRSLKPLCPADKGLPVIFNEYMHLSWDDPRQERTHALAPLISSLGVDIYVIDCGWHDEVPTNLIYHNIGEWRESKLRFPEGVRKTADLIHSLGMKFGLWIEPEAVGKDNRKMIEFYGEDCFLRRNGEKICELGRLLLDFRKEKVRSYLSDVIDRMVNEYKADYIKIDYNQEVGMGTDTDAFTIGEGLRAHCEARHKWMKEMTEKYPQVIFENCASGGQRMDYKTLSIHPLSSTSDQIHYYLYPYIVGNIFSSVIPEQAAVWSYPVNSVAYKAEGEKVDKVLSNELVAMNMINSLLGRIHLASRLNLLSESKLELIKKGIEYYNYMTPYKLDSVPYYPCGHTRWGDNKVCVGLNCGKKLFLAIWHLGGEKSFAVDLSKLDIKSVKVGYPDTLSTSFSLRDKLLTVEFNSEECARLFEIDLE
ncbi:MAG: hypothetical protein E7646_06725 [Ruminococcaceae bacterium]|nr:hypothetical protein [Oscillospiraceae bacterium]